VLQTLVFALVAGGALIVGAAAGSLWAAPRRLQGAMLAFGAGALVVAVAFELFEPAHEDAGLARAALAFVAGGAVFVGVDLLLLRYTGSEAIGLALVAAVTLDGVPENVALGVSLEEGGSLALLAAVVASNLPEAYGGAAEIRATGGSRARALGTWAATGGLLAIALVCGRVAGGTLGEAALGMFAAFAAGAVLASIAVTVLPEAYTDGGPLVAFATLGGFLTAYALTTV
jgi:ZIP family zinc transporter